MKPGHAIILERDRYSPLFAIRCDPAECHPKRGAPAGNCQREGCWISSAARLEDAEGYIQRHQLRETARRL